MPFQNKTISKKGFTLIELLVVVAILAVLASVILISTNLARQKGNDSRRKRDLQAINAALVAYYADNHTWPIIGTTYTYTSTSVNLISILSLYFTSGKVPTDPLTATGTGGSAATDACDNMGYIYCYRLSSDKTKYTLWAQLDNPKDSELSSNSNSKCQNGDFTGSYASIGQPAGNILNYCLKSPTN